jgi:DNA-binding GntR family transcriptional regulator
MPAASVRVGLTDHAEWALRAWLSTGRYRPGDRLPPEHELTRSLGVSRRTLRVALERLEEEGTIDRRRGSGTFVASLEALGPGLEAGLEMLESYTELARRQGIDFHPRDVSVRLAPPTPEVAGALEIPESERVVRVRRTMLIDGEPAIFIIANVKRVPELPPLPELRREVGPRRKMMVMDVLLERGAAIGSARVEIGARLIYPDDEIGRALGATDATAVIEMTETLMDAAGRPIQHSHASYAPGKLKLHVMRASVPTSPARVRGTALP